jgi:quercetin dioxygenase-like cupin family protein
MKAFFSKIMVNSAALKPLKSKRLKSCICQFPMPFSPEQGQIWKPHYIFSGFSTEMKLSCHVSALKFGGCPHPPHKHVAEEILFLLEGEAELLLPENEKKELVRIKSGNFVYYPAQFAHSLKAVSIEPVNYLMFRWVGRCWKDGEHLPYLLHDFFEFIKYQDKKQGLQTSLIFQGPTGYLRKLHCHSSELAPGAGYDAHRDDYDVAIILLEGEVETLGESVGPNSVIFYRAGEPHGMLNPGNKIARYLVFEFHSRHETIFAILKNFMRKVMDLERWKRKIKYWKNLFELS